MRAIASIQSRSVSAGPFVARRVNAPACILIAASGARRSWLAIQMSSRARRSSRGLLARDGARLGPMGRERGEKIAAAGLGDVGCDRGGIDGSSLERSPTQ
jgi:hypothetical protein